MFKHKEIFKIYIGLFVFGAVFSFNNLNKYGFSLNIVKAMEYEENVLEEDYNCDDDSDSICIEITTPFTSEERKIAVNCFTNSEIFRCSHCKGDGSSGETVVIWPCDSFIFDKKDLLLTENVIKAENNIKGIKESFRKEFKFTINQIEKSNDVAGNLKKLREIQTIDEVKKDTNNEFNSKEELNLFLCFYEFFTEFEKVVSEMKRIALEEFIDKKMIEFICFAGEIKEEKLKFSDAVAFYGIIKRLCDDLEKFNALHNKLNSCFSENKKNFKKDLSSNISSGIDIFYRYYKQLAFPFFATKSLIEKTREDIVNEYDRKKEELEKDRLEKDRLDKDRLDKDRLDKERKEKDILEEERLEEERLEKEKVEKSNKIDVDHFFGVDFELNEFFTGLKKEDLVSHEVLLNILQKFDKEVNFENIINYLRTERKYSHWIYKNLEKIGKELQLTEGDVIFRPNFNNIEELDALNQKLCKREDRKISLDKKFGSELRTLSYPFYSAICVLRNLLEEVQNLFRVDQFGSFRGIMGEFVLEYNKMRIKFSTKSPESFSESEVYECAKFYHTMGELLYQLEFSMTNLARFEHLYSKCFKEPNRNRFLEITNKEDVLEKMGQFIATVKKGFNGWKKAIERIRMAIGIKFGECIINTISGRIDYLLAEEKSEEAENYLKYMKRLHHTYDNLEDVSPLYLLNKEISDLESNISKSYKFFYYNKSKENYGDIGGCYVNVPYECEPFEQYFYFVYYSNFEKDGGKVDLNLLQEPTYRTTDGSNVERRHLESALEKLRENVQFNEERDSELLKIIGEIVALEPSRDKNFKWYYLDDKGNKHFPKDFANGKLCEYKKFLESLSIKIKKKLYYDFSNKENNEKLYEEVVRLFNYLAGLQSKFKKTLLEKNMWYYIYVPQSSESSLNGLKIQKEVFRVNGYLVGWMRHLAATGCLLEKKLGCNNLFYAKELYKESKYKYFFKALASSSGEAIKYKSIEIERLGSDDYLSLLGTEDDRLIFLPKGIKRGKFILDTVAAIKKIDAKQLVDKNPNLIKERDSLINLLAEQPIEVKISGRTENILDILGRQFLNRLADEALKERKEELQLKEIIQNAVNEELDKMLKEVYNNLFLENGLYKDVFSGSECEKRKEIWLITLNNMVKYFGFNCIPSKFKEKVCENIQRQLEQSENKNIRQTKIFNISNGLTDELNILRIINNSLKNAIEVIEINFEKFLKSSEDKVK